MATIGLRVDVDTFRGTRDGVSSLLRVLNDHSVRASFFFSLGPDNMGRHLFRLARPAFLRKMFRSRAANLYGWDIVLRGTLWPGPVIGEKLKHLIRAAAEEGHEVGFHAWDHHAWQTRIERTRPEDLRKSIARGVEMLAGITGSMPACSAAPGWKCTDRVLTVKDHFPFVFNSDCRGKSVFRPLVDGKMLSQPQVPATLPTYDELAGHDAVNDENYNAHLLSLVRPDGLNVLTIHAEVEGIAHSGMFRSFLGQALSLGHEFKTLGSILAQSGTIPKGTIEKGQVAGRDGWVAVQKSSLDTHQRR